MPMTTPAQLAPKLNVKNVLVPADFSLLSESAVKLARAIARQHGSTIHLANVIEPFGRAAVPPSKVHNADIKSAITEFGFLESRYLDGVKHERVLLNGDVNISLLHAINERNIDLVVMATRGAEGCERLLEGAITEELFRQAVCPVLVIGPNAKQDKDDFERFASFRNLLYPMEIRPSSISAIPYVTALLDSCAARVALLHVAHPDIQSGYERQRIRERLTAEMIGLFPNRAKEAISDVIVEFGPIANTIIEFSIARKADAIVLGVRSGGAFTRTATHIPWSVAHQIISQALCPVLTIRGNHEGSAR